MKLQELSQRIEAELTGDPDIEITSAGTLETAGPGQVSFLSNAKYARSLSKTRASAVIVGGNVRTEGVNLLRSRDPYYAFTRAIVILHGHRKHPFTGVHEQAFVESTASVGEGSTLYPGCYVGARAKVGKDCILYPNVVIYDDCVVGDRCILHAGAVIGADGYGFATHDGMHHKTPQIGNVVVEDDVEIGPNTTISRAAIDSTRIGRGSKLDQSVVVGHNTQIGPHCLLVAQVGVAGSVNIGHHVSLAGQVGVAGHLKIADNVQVGGKSGVMADLEEPGAYVGIPAMPYAHSRRVYSVFAELPDLLKRVRELEQRVADLTGDGEGGEVV